MKKYKMYSGIITLVILEILSFVLFSKIGIESVFAVWAGVFGTTFFNKLFKLEGMSELKGGMVVSGRGVHLAETIVDYDTVKSTLTARGINEEKKGKFLFMNIKTKWLYLMLFVINLLLCLFFLFIY